MILVTGSTGLNGSELLRRLSARGVAVRALVRHPAKAEAIAALPHVEVVQGDMARPETLMPALRDVDRAMLISSSDGSGATGPAGRRNVALSRRRAVRIVR
jgi:uncharacterized protein YbjT (DUF2867 family)